MIPLPFCSEPIEELLARLRPALTPLTPGCEERVHTFDFHDGMRMVVSRCNPKMVLLTLAAMAEWRYPPEQFIPLASLRAGMTHGALLKYVQIDFVIPDLDVGPEAQGRCVHFWLRLKEGAGGPA